MVLAENQAAAGWMFQSLLSSRPVLPDVPLDPRAVITGGNVCLIVGDWREANDGSRGLIEKRWRQMKLLSLTRLL